MKADRYEWESQIALITETKMIVYTDLDEFTAKLIRPLNAIPTGVLLQGGSPAEIAEQDRKAGNFEFYWQHKKTHKPNRYIKLVCAGCRMQCWYSFDLNAED